MPRAPKSCNEPSCSALVYDGGRYCDVHLKPWAAKQFDKRRTDTAEHRALKSFVLERAGHQCEIAYPGVCIGFATQVDRRDNAKGYIEDNCQAGCEPCHRKKTSMEGHAARGHRT